MLPPILTSDSFGPAMNKLPVIEQMFVCNLFTSPKSMTKAAELSGYTAPTRNALRQKAHYLLRKPAIQEAIREESKRRTVLLLPAAQVALANLLAHPEHSDHWKAIKTIRDDGGASKIMEKVLNVNVNVSQQEKIAAIVRFCKVRGIDPSQMLGFDPEGGKKQPIEVEVEDAGTDLDQEIEDLL